MPHEALFEQLTNTLLDLGAYAASVVNVSDIETDVSFRTLCEQNLCGNYGRNWMCPPYAGDIQDLIDHLRGYTYALVYQTVGELEDSYDFEGMMDAAAKHNALMLAVRDALAHKLPSKVLHLGAGGCHVCDTCAIREDKSCRHPDKAVASLETYGVNVSKLATTAGMKYINGQNTVTYFGAVLFCL